MKRFFADANIFLRFFTSDDHGQHEKAAALLKKAAAGQVSLVTGPPVFFEIAWTLRAGYRQPKEKILEVLSAIAAMPGLSLVDGETVLEAISLAQRSGAEYADAYIAAAARRHCGGGVATFNRRHFERLGIDLADM